tara:strand:- start:11 stop:202 length:192 start_codon:yes stop_codon:yes gene_type:complete
MTNNKKIYTLVICYDEEEDVIEWVQESIEREEELPDDIYETKELEELENYLDEFPDITEIGKA